MRILDPLAAVFGLLLVWLSSSLLLVYLTQIRFYMPLVLFSAVAVLATERCLDERVSKPRAVLEVFCANACLVLIHMLGIVYSAVLLAVALLRPGSRKRSLLLSLAGVGSWFTLLPCITAIRNGSLNATSQPIPGLRDIFRFYLKSSASTPVLLVALLGLIWMGRALLRRTASGERQRRTTVSVGVVLCLAFMLAPLCLYALSHLGRPLGQVRYLLPYYLSLSTLCAYAIAGLGRSGTLNTARAGLCVVAALTAVQHRAAIRSLPHDSPLDTADLRTVATGEPIVVSDEQTFFRLQYYRSDAALQFHFLLPPTQDRAAGMMASIARRGYFSQSFTPIDRFEQKHRTFFFVASVVPGSIPWIAREPSCHSRLVSSIMVDGMRDPVYAVSDCGRPVPGTAFPPSFATK